MTSEQLWQLEQNEKQEWPAQELLFTDREWFEAKMFGQYEQRENREEVVVFRRADLAHYVSMIREYDATIIAEAEREACIKVIEAYQIPVGNSPAGELACDWTYDALKQIRDEIRERGE